MEMLIIVILIAIIVTTVTHYFILSETLGNIIEQLKIINSTKTNSKILISAGNKQTKELALEINKNLAEKQKTEIEYKRMDLELRQAISNISHDLRTPLTSIMGYMQLIEDSSLSDKEKKQYIDIVKGRSKSLEILISSFYDLSRLEAKEYKFELKALNVSSIICEITASFYKNFTDKGIEPIFHIDEKVALVIADENALGRIFSNLMQNILNYSNKSVSISLEQHKGYLITVFQNDAPDLLQEDVCHLFERFFTADRTRGGKSTGLGLAITKQLVEQMGHTIGAELTDGKLSIQIKWKN